MWVNDSDRLQKAKLEIAHGRTSVSTLKNDFRNKFFIRMRTTRSKSIDKFRKLVENYGENMDCSSIKDLREALLSDPEAANLLKCEDVNEFLQQIESELKQVELEYQGQQYLEDSRRETDCIVENLYNACNVCDEQVDGPQGETICNSCKKFFDSNQF